MFNSPFCIERIFFASQGGTIAQALWPLGQVSAVVYRELTERVFIVSVIVICHLNEIEHFGRLARSFVQPQIALRGRREHVSRVDLFLTCEKDDASWMGCFH